MEGQTSHHNCTKHLCVGRVIYLCVRGQLSTKTEGCDQQPNKHVVLRLGRGGVHRASIKLHL